jgi:hypothetical protein
MVGRKKYGVHTDGVFLNHEHRFGYLGAGMWLSELGEHEAG